MVSAINFLGNSSGKKHAKSEALIICYIMCYFPTSFCVCFLNINVYPKRYFKESNLC